MLLAAWLDNEPLPLPRSVAEALAVTKADTVVDVMPVLDKTSFAEPHLRIPAEAGMGGGSSDAASCLIALNRLWGLGLSRPALADIGLQLGADVPFFIGGHNAWVEGIGELLTPLSLPAADFVVDTTASDYSFSVPVTMDISDPYSFLYSSPFTASLPSVNCIA